MRVRAGAPTVARPVTEPEIARKLARPSRTLCGPLKAVAVSLAPAHSAAASSRRLRRRELGYYSDEARWPPPSGSYSTGDPGTGYGGVFLAPGLVGHHELRGTPAHGFSIVRSAGSGRSSTFVRRG